MIHFFIKQTNINRVPPTHRYAGLNRITAQLKLEFTTNQCAIVISVRHIVNGQMLLLLQKYTKKGGKKVTTPHVLYVSASDVDFTGLHQGKQRKKTSLKTAVSRHLQEEMQ